MSSADTPLVQTVTLRAPGTSASVGLAYGIAHIVRPLREARAVFRALVANFVLVPLLAVGIERVIPIDPQFALGIAPATFRWLLSTRTPHVGLPTPEPVPV